MRDGEGLNVFDETALPNGCDAGGGGREGEAGEEGMTKPVDAALGAVLRPPSGDTDEETDGGGSRRWRTWRPGGLWQRTNAGFSGEGMWEMTPDFEPRTGGRLIGGGALGLAV